MQGEVRGQQREGYREASVTTALGARKSRGTVSKAQTNLILRAWAPNPHAQIVR